MRLSAEMLPPAWEFERPTDVLLIRSHALLVAKRAQIYFRDGVLVLGSRAFDQSQVRVRRAKDARRLYLELQTGEHVRVKLIEASSADQCAALLAAINRWLDDDSNDGSSSAGSRSMLEWEASRAQDEEELRRTVVRTLLYLCRQLFRQPTQFAVFFLACVCFGLGMVRSMLNEVYARENGTWHDASCVIERQHFEAEATHTVSQGVLWKVTGTYEANVRFEDGCDDGAWRLAAPADGAADAPVITFFESFDISDQDATPADVLDLDLELAPAVATAELAELGTDAGAGGSERLTEDGFAEDGLSENKLTEDGAPDSPPAAATDWQRPAGAGGDAEPDDAEGGGAAERRAAGAAAAAAVDASRCSPDHDPLLDQLRGVHVAYRRLVLDHDDFCYGPKGSNVTTALRHCQNTQAVWMRHKYGPGSHARCFIFARAHADGSVEAHVVMHKGIPWDVRAYLVYWVLLLALFAWLLGLHARRCLQRHGHLASAQDEAITAESKDILSLSHGVGQPGSELAARVERMYSRVAERASAADGAALFERPAPARATWPRPKSALAKPKGRRSFAGTTEPAGIAPFLPLL
ncbi:hypothetical protein KFE25_002147 [Diacronema lutheri]|uniref:Uncharacterized protein n=2 Tax=Diacronema lutheri TaxID=2081491 RepID=A0A8J5XCX8_DIALT|nr:hypothetical protein KFE25_002147 [Diacronema lutheri]